MVFFTYCSKMLFPDMCSVENLTDRKTCVFVLILEENAHREYSPPSENLHSTTFCFWEDLNFLDNVYFLKF